ncbi:MAG: hypothetical protein Satyrvirus29_9 [Satyrvirus sp.]|uniref:Uncharacterized protein n=1 Tax=Satyrvirus sp. TaxID=2487771 RepID=A0A3G5AEV8_9VIRU|nr:MAG: hypothetical protein Satyrvirus29_9 [Satyrvirus sp.]
MSDKYYGCCIKIYDLVSSFYEEISIPNPKYHDPLPCCSHFASVKEMVGHNFCSSCGIPAVPRITSKTFKAFQIKKDLVDILAKNEFPKIVYGIKYAIDEIIKIIKNQNRSIWFSDVQISVIGYPYNNKSTLKDYFHYFDHKTMCERCYLSFDEYISEYDIAEDSITLIFSRFTLNLDHNLVNEIASNKDIFTPSEDLDSIIELNKMLHLYYELKKYIPGLDLDKYKYEKRGHSCYL